MKFSNALARRIDGRSYVFNSDRGELHLASEVIYCKPSEDGWVEDADRPARSISVPVVPTVRIPLPEWRL